MLIWGKACHAANPFTIGITVQINANQATKYMVNVTLYKINVYLVKTDLK